MIYFRYIDSSNEIKIDQRLIYKYPAGKLLLDVEFEIPENPGINAKLTVYKADNPIAQPHKETQLEFGFLIKSGNVVHEVSTIDSRFRWHPFMNQIYGVLQCDHINVLLNMMDKDGSTTDNPSSVIDPSRYAGLNREHPFIEALMRVPKVRIDYILRQLDSAASKRSIQMNEFNEIIDELEKYGLQIFDDMPSNHEWISNYDSDLIKAIQNDRQKYVNVERNFMLESNDICIGAEKDILTKLSGTNNSNKQSYVYMIDNSGNVVEIPMNNIDITSQSIGSGEIKQFYNYLLSKIDASSFSTRPYIYQLTEDGHLVKLFIFNDGQLGDLTDCELQSVKKNNKILNIHFTKDINMIYRYNILISNGKIDITISLNDPIISKFLVTNQVNPDGSINDENVTFNMTSLQNIGNNKSYIFLGEMFIEIFARIILYGKAQSGNIIINSNDTNSLLHTMDAHYETVASSIQVPITNIFNSYYEANSIKLINLFADMIATSLSVDVNLLDNVKNDLKNNFAKLF